jgi:hypothetical protein
MFQDSPRFFSRIFVAAAGLALVGLPHEVRSDDTSSTSSGTDKGQFNLFNPTPAGQLRPLAIDANDGVVDPTTVDAGHVQVEGSLVDYYTVSQNYSSPFTGSGTYNQNTFGWSPRISLGLLNNVALFVHPTFYYTSYNYSGPFGGSGNSSGYSGIIVGTKINLWGNDSGTTAFAVSPYLSIPNGDNGGSPVLGGADISFAVRLPHQFYLKFMTEPYAFDNTDGTVHFGMDNSMSVHKSLDQFDIYAYLNTNLHASPALWYGYAGFGAAYLVTDNLQLFVGIGFGLNSNAYDYNPRFGLGWRF